jgi:GNAT superfamily N-acetyltransferase
VDPIRSITSSVPTSRIRRIGPADHDRLRAFYADLSDESRRTRFLGATSGIGDEQSDWFCCPDHSHREGFVATIDQTATADRFVGHACIEPDGPSSAEIAVAVAEDARGQGIGRALVEAAVAWARRDGFVTLTATMLAANPPIQRLLTSLDLATTARSIGAGVIEIRIDLGPGRSAA